LKEFESFVIWSDRYGFRCHSELWGCSTSAKRRCPEMKE